MDIKIKLDLVSTYILISHNNMYRYIKQNKTNPHLILFCFVTDFLETNALQKCQMMRTKQAYTISSDITQSIWSRNNLCPLHNVLHKYQTVTKEQAYKYKLWYHPKHKASATETISAHCIWWQSSWKLMQCVNNRWEQQSAAAFYVWGLMFRKHAIRAFTQWGAHWRNGDASNVQHSDGTTDTAPPPPPPPLKK